MKRICIFGDSITWGSGLPFREAWANLLRNYLEGLEPIVELYDLGIDRDTTRELLVRLENEAKNRKADALIFAVGINDSVFRGTKDNSEIPIAEFKKNIEALIKKAGKITNQIIFVGLVKGDDSLTKPLPRSTTGKCYDKENTRIYNQAIKDICSKMEIRFIDLFDELGDSDFYDGLHPNLEGHRKMFKEIKESLIKNKIIPGGE